MVFRLGLLVIFCGFSWPVFAAESIIAVAANFAAPVKKIAAIFEQKTGHKIRISVGSSGKIYVQIINGAPFDAFLSADQQKPTQLSGTDLAVKNSQYTYATGRLVLWMPSESSEILAFANPKTAPYGLAAQQVMKNETFFDQQPRKIIMGENVTQTFQFVNSGAADMGFVALSQVLHLPTSSYKIIPDDLYLPIKQDLVLLRHGKDNIATLEFLKFLRSQKIKDMVRSFGYK